MLLITTRQTDWFSAVLSLPAGVAHDFSALSAGEVSESIVSRPTEDGAALTVVVLVTNKSIRVFEFCSPAAVEVLGPLIAHGQVPLCRHSADNAVRVF